MNKSRLILKESVWLVISIGITFLIATLLGTRFSDNVIDLHLFDTYVVVSGWQLISGLFPLVTFLIYIVKEKHKSFTRTLPNWIIIISGGTLIIFLSVQTKVLSTMMMSYTLYPPLSALGNSKEGEITKNTSINLIVNSFTVMQFGIMAILVYVAYRWGGSKIVKPL